MTFTYTYQLSGGERKSGSIEARSREEAFAALRKEGIRAIRVTEDPACLARRRRTKVAIAVAGAVALVAAVAVTLLMTSAKDGMFRWGDDAGHGRYRAETAGAFNELRERANDLRQHYRYSLKISNFYRPVDYSQMTDASRVEQLMREFQMVRSIMSESRERIRELFAGIYKLFPAASVNERMDAQKLYGEIMDEIDTDESRVDNSECIVMLLDGNREKWRVRDGRIEFTDQKLARDVKFFSIDSGASTARWRRDFGAGGEGEGTAEAHGAGSDGTAKP